MQGDFHYYATYCAAVLAGFDHKHSVEICHAAQLVDHCSRTWLIKVGGPAQAATTQLQTELLQARTDPIGLCDITRIWSSFHFLPRDLYADIKIGSKNYKDKYRLICGPNGDLLVDTVKLAKDKGTPAIGIAMHVLADTWAHTYFAGTPSLVINNTNWYFYELFPGDDVEPERRQVTFSHNPSASEDVYKPVYVGSVYQSDENSIMNLGHGRAGHLPDYSYIRYVYLPAWGGYKEIIKDNPHDYECAFAQMVYACHIYVGKLTILRKTPMLWKNLSHTLRRSVVSSRNGRSMRQMIGKPLERAFPGSASLILTRMSILGNTLVATINPEPSSDFFSRLLLPKRRW